MAVELVEEAIKLDPDFVRAYLGLSSIHSWMYFGGYDRTKERLAKSKAALDKALELAPDLPKAKESLAWYYYRGFLDYGRALELLDAVQKARPNMAPVLFGFHPATPRKMGGIHRQLGEVVPAQSPGQRTGLFDRR